MLRKALLTLGLTSMISPAAAEDFSYTFIEAGLGLIVLEEDLQFTTEVYEDFGLLQVQAGYRLNENVALEVGAGVYGNEGDRTEITETSASFSFLFPVKVSDMLIVAPRVGQMTRELEGCFDNTCITEDDTSIIYGADLRAWALRDQLELNMGFRDTASGDFSSNLATLDNERSERAGHVISMGGALWVENHSLRLDVAEDESVTRFTLGYRYSW